MSDFYLQVFKGLGLRKMTGIFGSQASS